MIIDTLEELEAIYRGPVTPASTVKEVDRITPHYRALIEASPFAILATCGPEGLDCSPRGDKPGFVRVKDERTLLMPDRRGNNRIDSLRNVVGDPRVGLLFLIPGSGTTLRVKGRGFICAKPELLESLAIDHRPPRTVLVVVVERVYFQCARAVVRSDLWNPARRVDPSALPSPGAMLAALSDDEVRGPAYDAEWPGRAAQTLW